MKRSRLIMTCFAALLFLAAMLAHSPSSATTCWCVGPWTVYASATGTTCSGAISNLAGKLGKLSEANCDPYGVCSELDFSHGACYIANNRITVDGSLTYECWNCFPEGDFLD